MSSKPLSPHSQGALTSDVARGLVHELIDDAAVFPPGNAPLAQALIDHHGFRGSRYEDVVGPLLIPASAVGQLRELADPASLLRIGLIADTGLAGLIAARQAIQDDPWIELAHVEITSPPTEEPSRAMQQLLDELHFTVPAYIELPQDTDPTDAIEVIAADGAERVKFRCGPQDVPGPEVLARFIRCCTQANVPFKLTAGLHHAFPYLDEPLGIRQHGFLNTLAATSVAMNEGSLSDVADVLKVNEATILVEILSGRSAVSLRSIFSSFGSCSITEPTDELFALGFLTAEGSLGKEGLLTQSDANEGDK